MFLVHVPQIASCVILESRGLCTHLDGLGYNYGSDFPDTVIVLGSILFSLPHPESLGYRKGI